MVYLRTVIISFIFFGIVVSSLSLFTVNTHLNYGQDVPDVSYLSKTSEIDATFRGVVNQSQGGDVTTTTSSPSRLGFVDAVSLMYNFPDIVSSAIFDITGIYVPISGSFIIFAGLGSAIIIYFIFGVLAYLGGGGVH